ncbi:transcriptional regulator, TetR family [Quadrisphaera granulorum]|uniref:TetR family transcriptional regulator n=1 Tax=Quadrisphaera granulorum TaxID=317664 RepID=A0A316A9P1_9ACTN|nr:TetR/AcrR family transcriptional regulator [Quadrisphaera granulorum]PWJ54129.1 TetR family transcriptional regulator [Quadrisphaera granulorum]SZE96268.1 transcriptional regulator, TetR family [Quadrisphaera granulorum]
MGRTTGRTSGQTQQQVLRAAAEVVAERGGSAGLEEIASRAQVTKGGLLYHFGSKEALLHAVAQQLLDDFTRDVEAALAAEDGIDGSDDGADDGTDDGTDDDGGARTPGRLTRAYVRATLAAAADAERTRRATTLLVHLQTDPAVAAMMQADAERWRERLLTDGLDPLVATLAIAAADGICMAPLYGDAPLVDDKDRVLQAILDLTRRPPRP